MLLIRLLALFALLWTGKYAAKQISSVLHPQEGKQKTSQGEENSAEMVKDPVCQTYIPRSIAVQKTFNDTTVYFCSESCASKFADQQRSEM